MESLVAYSKEHDTKWSVFLKVASSAQTFIAITFPQLLFLSIFCRFAKVDTGYHRHGVDPENSHSIALAKDLAITHKVASFGPCG
jgi:hypothetical protein